MTPGNFFTAAIPTYSAPNSATARRPPALSKAAPSLQPQSKTKKPFLISGTKEKPEEEEEDYTVMTPFGMGD